jgi:uncharacterized protein
MSAVTQSGERIATLDIIRGVALMGIFGVNVIAFFARPTQACFNASTCGLNSPVSLGWWLTTFILIATAIFCGYGPVPYGLFEASLLAPDGW